MDFNTDPSLGEFLQPRNSKNPKIMTEIEESISLMAFRRFVEFIISIYIQKQCWALYIPRVSMIYMGVKQGTLKFKIQHLGKADSPRQTYPFWGSFSEFSNCRKIFVFS